MARYVYIPFYYFYSLFFISLLTPIESLFTPQGRLSHMSVLAENKIYFFGGVLDGGGDDFCSNQVFYLDLSKKFSALNPPWIDLTDNYGMPAPSCWGSASFTINQGQRAIHLFNGITSSNESIYTFDLNSLQWSMPAVKGTEPERRYDIRSVVDNSGKLFIFGGMSDKYVGSDKTHFFNEMILFDTAYPSWSILTSSPPAVIPSQRAGYSATFLPENGVVVYLGGYHLYNNEGEVFQDIPLSHVELYDTKSLTWTTKEAIFKDEVGSRDSHTAVLAPDGNTIIIYGGVVSNTGNDYAQPTPNLAVLNMRTDPYEWTAPLVSTNVGEVPALSSHSAHIVDSYMIVAFGNITQPNNYPEIYKNTRIYLLDTRNYTWVDTFDKPQPPPPPPKISDQPMTVKVIIGIISGIVGTATFITIYWL